MNDCRKAVNQAIFRPTAERKAAAIALLKAMMETVTNLEEVAEKPSKKANKKRRRKTTKKATPTQRVADRQEKAFHGKADSPVKPSKKAKTASVEAARESAKAVSEHTGAAQRAAKKAESNSNNADFASLEAKVEALTKALAIHMESALPTADFVSIDELPFEL